MRSLAIKKYRHEAGMFVVEGSKMVGELLASSSWQVQAVYALPYWIAEHEHLLRKYTPILTEINQQQLEALSQQNTPQPVLALVAIPSAPPLPRLSPHWYFALDHLQDPGNMGTIVRTADWLGMSHLFCSPDCVDVFNPKTVQSSMGSVLRVQVHYHPLDALFDHYQLPVWGAMLQGSNLFEAALTQPLQGGFLLIGNEANGIRTYLQPHISHPITIPRQGQAESLNAAIAAAIIGSVAVNTRPT